MTGSRELLEAMPRHDTAHAALLADFLDIICGASVRPEDPPVPQQVEQLPPAFKETLALHIDAQRRAGAVFLFESSWEKPHSGHATRQSPEIHSPPALAD